MLLRSATKADVAWVDEQYGEAGFIPSDLAVDDVVIAEVNGERAGLGRLVRVGGGAFELGGIFITAQFRSGGIARAIVGELIRLAGPADVYCVPFSDLEDFYASCGFRRHDGGVVPPKVQEKLDWCARDLLRAVTLMKLDHQR